MSYSPGETIDIVMFNMSCYTEWQGGIANRNFYVLHNLLKHPRVRKIVAIDYLPHTKKRALRQWVQNVLFGVRGKVVSRGFFYKLTAVRESEIEQTGFKLEGVPANTVPYRLFIYSDVQSAWNEEPVYGRLQKELERLDLRNVVLWSYLPTFVGYFSKLDYAVSVFDAVDNWLEHSAYIAFKERLRTNYRIIGQQAKVVFAVAQALIPFLRREGRARCVPNGVQIEEIQAAPRLVGRDVAALPRPIIGYIGTLQKDRVDTALIEYLARANPSKSFVIVGATGLLWPSLRNKVGVNFTPLPNIHLVGRKSHRERGAYLREFDACIIPHLVNRFNEHTSPMKLFEYLAAGKPVVSTAGAGVEEFRDVVHIAQTKEEFNQELLKALSENLPADVARRQAIVQQHTWEKRVEIMLEDVFAALESKG